MGVPRRIGFTRLAALGVAKPGASPSSDATGKTASPPGRVLINAQIGGPLGGQSGKHLLILSLSAFDRCCRKSLRKRTVELEFETIEFPAGGFLNQDCAFSFVLESMLLATHRKIPFSTASVKLRKNSLRANVVRVAPESGHSAKSNSSLPHASARSRASACGLRAGRRPAFRPGAASRFGGITPP